MVTSKDLRSQGGPAISVITASYNAAATLPQLIASLTAQTDKDFEWVLADGGSNDNTCELAKEADGIDVAISSQPDFGIYDALNRGIKRSKAKFYMVVGADDQLSPDAIENFKKYISSEVDIIAANVEIEGIVRRPGRGKSWLYGQYQFVSAHAVATVFKKSLHQSYGDYSRHFPIAADQLFIKRCAQGGANIVSADFVAGFFGLDGVSARDSAGTLSEFFRVQLLTEKYKSLQLFLYVVRLFKNYLRL